MRVAAIELNSTDDVDRNLRTAGRLVRDAGAELGMALVADPDPATLAMVRRRLPTLSRRVPGGYARGRE